MAKLPAFKVFAQNFRLDQQAGLSLIELMIAVGLSSLVAVGGIQFYQRMQAQAERKMLVQSTVEEQRLLTELIKGHWDTKNIHPDCTARVVKTSIACQNSWTNQSDFGFQLGAISTTTLMTAWLPRLQIYYRIWTSDTTQVARTMSIETKCKAAPASIIKQIPNLLPNPQDCQPCAAGQVPFVEVLDGSGTSRIFPPHLANVSKMSLNRSLGMRVCFKFHGNPRSYGQAGTQDPQLQVQLQSLLSNPAGNGLMLETKSISFPMLRPSTLKIERRVK